MTGPLSIELTHEYRAFLTKYNVEYDERYVWDTRGQRRQNRQNFGQQSIAYHMSESRQDKILSTIGLKRHMVWPAPDYVVYDESKFLNYVASEYRDSERRRSDKFYRMFEITLLHNDSGLRIGYTTTESYDGETVEYKLIDIFIITLANERLEIVDIDFKKKLFFTTNKIISFGDINMSIE